MQKFYIPIILGSTRRERQSPKVARFVHNRLGGRENIGTEIIDLKELNLPIMEERLRFRNDPPPGLVEFSGKMNRADSIVIVTPEYNNGYPGVLKNTLDYLLPEYKRKPFGIVTVSGGGFGGMYCLAQLRLVILGMGALPIPAAFPVSTVQNSFDADGSPKDPAYEKRAETFITELLWYTEAVAVQRAKSS
jgi:NAD(P)H-dependent FMN reductase